MKKLLEIIKKAHKGIFHFGKASLTMTIISFGWQVLIYDLLNLKVLYMFFFNVPLFFMIRYWVYKKIGGGRFGRYKENG